MIAHITVTSKNLMTIKDFSYLLKNYSIFNFYIIKKSLPKNKKKSIITILKSPHVNKKAQEQFEYQLFLNQFSVNTTQNLKYLIFLKKLSNNLFPDIKIKIKFIIDCNYKKKLNILNLDNYSINEFYNLNLNINHKKINKLKNKNKKIQNFIKILTHYGAFFKMFR